MRRSRCAGRRCAGPSLRPFDRDRASAIMIQWQGPQQCGIISALVAARPSALQGEMDLRLAAGDICFHRRHLHGHPGPRVKSGVDVPREHFPVGAVSLQPGAVAAYVMTESCVTSAVPRRARCCPSPQCCHSCRALSFCPTATIKASSEWAATSIYNPHGVRRRREPQ